MTYPTTERDTHRTPTPTARADLDALARCLPTLLGRASPLARTIAGSGQGECAPAERVQQWLTAAMRAMRRLAAMRTEHWREVLALLGTYVYQGHTSPTWAQDLSLALRDRDARTEALRSLTGHRAGSGPDTHSLVSEGAYLIARAEVLYEVTDGIESGGEWLSADLEQLTRLLSELRADRLALRAVPIKRAEKPGSRTPVETVRRQCALPETCATREQSGTQTNAQTSIRSGLMRWPSKCVGRDGRLATPGLGVPEGWVERVLCAWGKGACR